MVCLRPIRVESLIGYFDAAFTLVARFDLSVRAVMTGLREALSRFRDDVSGAIIIIFVAIIAIVIFAVGFAVDVARAQRVSNTLLASLDAAALVGAKGLVDEELSDADVRERIEKYFTTQMASADLNIDLSDLTVTIDRPNGVVQVDAGAVIPTTLTHIFNYKTMTLRESARTKYLIKKAEVALVLDTTGSMQTNGRIHGLKDAAKAAIEMLLPPAEPAINRVSVVPYSTSVKPGIYVDPATNMRSADGCVVERLGTAANSDEAPADPPVVGTPDTWVKVAADIPPMPDPVPAPPADENRYDCPTELQELMPLSKVKADLDAKIDSLEPDGWTAGHIGLAWGWYTLSPNWSGVFTGLGEPKPYTDDKTVKALVLMTDGMFNTSYLNGPMNTTSDTQALELCDAIKAAGVKIYTVGFEIDNIHPPADEEARELLRECASPGGSGKLFYEADDADELLEAFKTIVTDIQALRLTK